MDANDQSEFSKLTLAQQYAALAKLRACVVAISLGDDELLDKLLGADAPQDEPDAEAVEIADAVDAWLAGGEA